MAVNDLELALRIRAAFEGQQAITNLASSFIDVNKKIENLQRGLQAISGSTEGAIQEFTYLEEVSRKFGLSILDLADNYVKLSASAKETNLEGDATRKIFEATASTMAVLGGDTITTERAFRALGQMMSKGQIYAEELKGQLAEAIPGALQIMSRALGISTAQVLQLMEAGQLGSDVLLPFAKQLENEYGHLASSSTTFTQAINRIQTEWNLLAKKIGDTGAFMALSKVMDVVGKNAEVMAGAFGSLATIGLVMLGKGLVNVVSTIHTYIASTRLAANATQQSAVATLEKATADTQAALATRNAAQSALIAATNNEVAARGTAQHAAAVRSLSLAQAQSTIANNNYKAATEGVILAQNRLIASQGLLSRAWSFLTGPAGLIALVAGSFVAMTMAFRGQDEATNTLSKSTEDYKDEVEKLTAAQLNLLNIAAKKQSDDNKERIENIKSEIDFLHRKMDAEKQGIAIEGARELSLYGIWNAIKNLGDSEAQLTQAQADLDESTKELELTEVKRSIGLGGLAQQYINLNKSTKDQQANLNSLNRDLLEQQKVINNSRQTYEALVDTTGRYSSESIGAHQSLGQALDGLRAIEKQRDGELLKSKDTQTQINDIIRTYVEVSGVSNDVIRAALLEDQNYIDGLDAKSKAIALSVQNLVRLTAEEKALATQVKQSKVELDKYEKTQLSGVDAKLRESIAIGDLNAIRETEIAKAKIQQNVAQQALTIEQSVLSEKQRQLSIEEELFKQNEKGRAKTQEKIDKLKLEITAQEGVIAQKKADVVATGAQAAAIERANTLIGSSVIAQQQAILTTKDELEKLQIEYERLSAAGESVTGLNGVFEQIRQKQEDVEQQTKAMKGTMIAAFAAVGLDYEEVINGMDFETKRMIDAFSAIGLQAETTSDQLTNAFDNALAKSNTKKELEELGKQLLILGDKGVVSSEQVAVGLAAIQLKASELTNNLDPFQKALEKLGIGVPERLLAIAQQNEVLYNVIKKSKAPIDEVDKAFLSFAQSQLVAAEHGAAIDLTFIKNEASARGLSSAFEELQRQISETDPEIVAFITQMDRYAQQVARTNALNAQQRDVQQQVIETQKGLAEIIDDKNKIAKAEAQLAEQATQDAIQRINDLNTEKDAINQVIQKLIEEQKIRSLTPAETDTLRQYQDEAQAKQLFIDKSYEELDLLKKRAQQAALDAGPLGQEVVRTKEATNEIDRKVRALEKELEIKLKLQQQTLTDEQQKLQLLEADRELLDVEKESLDAQLQKAEADGDEEKANEIRLKQADNLIKKAEQEVKIAEQKVEVAKELVAMSEAEHEAAIKKAKAYREAQAAQEDLLVAERARFAEDGLTDKEKEALATIEANIAALKSEALSQDAAADAAEAAIEHGNKQVEIAEKSVEAAKKRVEAAKAEKNALEENIKSQDKETKSKNENTRSTYQNIDAKKASADAAEALQEKLDALKKKQDEEAEAAKKAADEEKKRLEAMKTAAQEAQQEVKKLNVELLRETGFGQEADLLSQRIAYETQVLELEKSIQEAKANGNKEQLAALEQQLSLAGQLNSVKIQNINDRYLQDAADLELSAVERIAEATQNLNDIVDESTQKRLEIEKDHLAEVTALIKETEEQRQALITKSQQALLDEEADYQQARKDHEVSLLNDIEQVNNEYRDTTLQLYQDYLDSIASEDTQLKESMVAAQRDATQAISDLHRDSAQSINELYQDLDASLVELNRDTQNKLASETKDLEQQLVATAKDTRQAFEQASSELNINFDQDIRQVYDDLAVDIANRQIETQQALADIDAEWLQNSLDSMTTLEQKSEDLRRKLLQQSGEQGQVLAVELGDELDALAVMYAQAGEQGKAVFEEAVAQAKKLYTAKIDGLHETEDLSDQQYWAAKKALTEQLSLMDQLVEQKKAQIDVEKQQQQQAVVDEAAQQDAKAKQAVTVKEQALQAELEAKRQQLEAEYALETEFAAANAEAKRTLLIQESAERQQAIKDEAAEKRRALQQEQVEQQQALEQEQVEKEKALKKELADTLNNLQLESSERLVQLNAEYEARKLLEATNNQNSIAELRNTSNESLLLLKNEHTANLQLLKEQQQAELLNAQQTYAEERKQLDLKTQDKLKAAKVEADQAVQLAAENVDKVREQIAVEVDLAKAKNAQVESQIKLNNSMQQTLELSKQISEGISSLNQSNLSGLLSQATKLNDALKSIEGIL